MERHLEEGLNVETGDVNWLVGVSLVLATLVSPGQQETEAGKAQVGGGPPEALPLPHWPSREMPTPAASRGFSRHSPRAKASPEVPGSTSARTTQSCQIATRGVIAGEHLRGSCSSPEELSLSSSITSEAVLLGPIFQQWLRSR